MSDISFRFYNKTQSKEILPQMFDILYSNMSRIAPTGNSYDKDKQLWLSFMESAPAENQQIILMYVDDILAGYFQYSINKDTIVIEEIEIKPEHQRTALFYRFFKYAVSIAPKDIFYAEAYINKYNSNSKTIAGKLGMQIIGENQNGSSWHLRGELKEFTRRFA